MNFTRSSGILLHPTSLPGQFGIGDIGPAAFRWIDFLKATGTKLWQMLPLGPTGYADSPYQSFSAMAGNPYLVSPEALYEDGLITKKAMNAHPDFPSEKVDYGALIPWKSALLQEPYRAHKKSASWQLNLTLSA